MATVFPSDAQRQQLTSVERHLPRPGVRNSSGGPRERARRSQGCAATFTAKPLRP